MSRALDCLVAERVMGFQWATYQSGKSFLVFTLIQGPLNNPVPVLPDGCLALTRDVPKYSTDIAAAWLVVERIGSALPENENCVSLFGIPGDWQCRIHHIFDVDETVPDWGLMHQGHAKTMPMAVCLAALRAFSVPEPDIGQAQYTASPEPRGRSEAERENG